MKRLALLFVLVAGCNDFEFELDLDLDFGGPVVGQRGVVTFSFVDGCTGGDGLFGCPKTMPMFAVGSQARFIVGSTTGDIEAERRLGRASVQSGNGLVAASRDADGLVVLDAIAPGGTTISLIEGGEVIDSIDVLVDAIAVIEGNAAPPPLMLAGAAFPANVTARSAAGTELFAHGAIAVQPFDALRIDPDVRGWFTSSEQFALRADVPGEARVQFWVDTYVAESRFRIVTREEITEVKIEELYPGPNPSKLTLVAATLIDGATVNGGPACDWRIVSGGGPNPVLSAAVGDPFSSALFVYDNSAVVYGSGEMVVECRANDRVAAQRTIMLAP